MSEGLRQGGREANVQARSDQALDEGRERGMGLKFQRQKPRLSSRRRVDWVKRVYLVCLGVGDSRCRCRRSGRLKIQEERRKEIREDGSRESVVVVVVATLPGVCQDADGGTNEDGVS